MWITCHRYTHACQGEIGLVASPLPVPLGVFPWVIKGKLRYDVPHLGGGGIRCPDSFHQHRQRQPTNMFVDIPSTTFSLILQDWFILKLNWLISVTEKHQMKPPSCLFIFQGWWPQVLRALLLAEPFCGPGLLKGGRSWVS